MKSGSSQFQAINKQTSGDKTNKNNTGTVDPIQEKDDQTENSESKKYSDDEDLNADERVDLDSVEVKGSVKSNIK